MNGTKVKQGDSLNQLNVDETELTFKEKTMLDMLYPSMPSMPTTQSTASTSQTAVPVVSPDLVPIVNALKEGDKVWHHFKDILVATGLFVALSLPLADSLIAKFVKIDDPNYRLAAKAALFALLLFLAHHFYLSRRTK